jgi:hypothetical protein
MSLVTALKRNRIIFMSYRRWKDLIHGRGWGGFHGDAVYRRLVLGLLEAFPFTSFVETGTSRGYSTELVAMTYPKLPVFTAEVLDETYQTSKFALGRYPNVVQLLGSSDEVVAKLIGERKIGELPLFYLDAHWEAYWPLLAEMRHIAGARLRTCMVIDDFEVPGQPQFEYDTYPPAGGSPGGNCNLDYMLPALDEANVYHAAFPRYTRADAFGPASKPQRDRLRGHIVLFQNMPQEYERFVSRPLAQQHYFGVGETRRGCPTAGTGVKP